MFKNPNMGLALMGLGQGMTQLGAGQPVNMSPTAAMLMERKQEAEQRKAVEGMMDGFSPEQRRVLASMPPGLAQKIIAQQVFAKPQGPNYQFVKDHGMVDMNNPPPELMAGQYQPPAEQPDYPSSVQEYQFAVQQGYSGTFEEYKRDMAQAGRSSININNGGEGPHIGPIKPGYQVFKDPETGSLRMSPIPGGPEDTTNQNRQKAINSESTGTVVQEDVARALQIVEQDGNWAAGLGAIFKKVPTSKAHTLGELLKTVKANAGFDKLQLMREASPTGGALGSVSDRENENLQAVIGSLEQSQDPEVLAYNLKRVNDIYRRVEQLYRLYNEFGPNIDPYQFGYKGPIGTPGQRNNLRYNPATGKLEPDE